MMHRRLLAGTGVLVVLLAVLGPRLLPAQVPQTRLLYEEGGVFGDPKTVTVRLTGPNGQVPPDTGATQSDDRVHFLYRPVGEWTFSDDATEALRKIALQQNGTWALPEEVTLRKEGGGIPAARVAYPRSKIDWLAPVAFAHEVDTSATTALPDVYAADYPTLRRPYDRGRRLIDAGQPLRALDTLAVFYGTVSPAFEFVATAKATLDTAAVAAVARRADTFQTLRTEVVSTPNAETLGRLEAFQAHLDTLRAALANYLDARPEAGAFVQERLDNLDESAAALYENAYGTYRQKTVRVFFREPYTRARPSLFVEVLARLALHPRPALGASGIGLDSLATDRITEPRYDDARQTLRQKRWWQDFQDVMTVVDNNLRRHDRLFGEKVLQSLKLNRTAATQPYYEILAALNAAGAGDQAAFRENWERALATTTNLGLLNAMQAWALTRRTPPEQVPASVGPLMTEAERLQSRRRSTEARRRLEKAARQTDDYAPLLYDLGRLAYEEGDTTVARTYFKRAQSVVPRYTVPKVAHLRLLLDQDDYDAALRRADSTLQQAPYWLVYFPKARALGGLDRTDEAVNVVRQRCEQLNDQSAALYVLMAELYTQQKAWKGAAWAVKQAEDREPRRVDFIPRLQTVRDTVRETEAVSLKEVSDDPAGSTQSGSSQNR
jgi:tetratricopeptide (TPR) repeat protein